MSEGAEVAARVTVPLPQEQAWRAVTDWSAQGRWMVATRVTGGHGAGATVVARTGIGPAAVTDTMVITEWDPPSRCVVRHTGRIIRGVGIFEVLPAGTGSEFRWTERLDLPFGGIGRLGWRVACPLAQRMLVVSLRRFARIAREG